MATNSVARIVLDSDQRAAFAAAGLDADTAQEYIDLVTSSGHRWVSDAVVEEMCRPEPFDRAVPLYNAVFKSLGIGDTTKATGFGLEGMKGATGSLSVEDLSPEYLALCLERLTSVVEVPVLRKAFDDISKGVAVTTLASFVEPGRKNATARLTLAVSAGLVPGFKFDPKKHTISSVATPETKAA